MIGFILYYKLMDEPQLEQWKMKKNPPNSKFSDANKLLTDDMGTSINIKSRVHRLSVLLAIKSTQERLKLF